MPAQKESLPSVTIAGIVAIVFSLFGLLGSFFAGLSVVVLPQLPATPGAPPTPPGFRGMMIAITLFMVALSIFGIFVGVSVIRLRNWARITILVWGGLMAVFCVGAVAFSFVIFNVMPEIGLPNARPGDVGQVMQFMKVFLIIFYGIPAAVGIWWLVLFTRPRVATAFASSMPVATALDASGFPQLSVAVQGAQPQLPRCPLPLAIVAGLLIFGAACLLIFAIFPVLSSMPFFVFGHDFGAAPGRFILICFALASGVTGVGILKLKPWALYTQIVFQFVGLLNCLVTFLNPNYVPAMRAAMEKMYSQNPAFVGGNPFLSDTYFRPSLIFASVFVAAVLALLLWQRSRFLEQAAAAAAAKA